MLCIVGPRADLHVQEDCTSIVWSALGFAVVASQLPATAGLHSRSTSPEGSCISWFEQDFVTSAHDPGGTGNAGWS